MTEEGEASSRVSISVSANGLTCSVTIAPGPDSDTPQPIEIMAALEEHGISHALIDEQAIATLLDLASAEPSQSHTAVVARGTQPVDGEHASFTIDPGLAERFEAARRRREAAERGEIQHDTSPAARREGEPVDFRAQCAFVIVEKGQVLGVVHPATDGTDGTGVRGETIPAKKGRSTPIKADRSVRFKDGFATAANGGVLRYHPGEIGVDPVLDLGEGVDYSTGNIDFPGEVIVRGGVRDNFTVRAAGLLTIRGLVEAAEIHGLQDVEFVHGMAGRDIGKVTVEGDLKAGYLDGVRGDIGGFLRVQREVKECRLCVARRIDAPSCAIFGGEVHAGQGIEAGMIGGAGGVTTLVTVGVSHQIGDLAERLSRMHDLVRTHRTRGEAEFQALQKQGAKLNAQQAERLTELQFEQITAADLERRVGAASQNLLGAARRLSSGAVIVHRAIHKGVTVRLRHVELRIKQSIVGHVRLELDQHGEPRCYLNNSTDYTPIGSVASVRTTDDPFDLLSRVAGEAA